MIDHCNKQKWRWIFLHCHSGKDYMNLPKNKETELSEWWWCLGALAFQQLTCLHCGFSLQKQTKEGGLILHLCSLNQEKGFLRGQRQQIERHVTQRFLSESQVCLGPPLRWSRFKPNSLSLWQADAWCRQANRNYLWTVDNKGFISLDRIYFVNYEVYSLVG